MGFVRTLRFRISMLFVLLLAIVMVFLSGLVYIGLQQTLLRAVDDSLQKAAERSISGNVPDDPTLTDDGRLRALALRALVPSRLIDLNGTTLSNDTQFPEGLAISEAALRDVANGNARRETVNLPEGAWRFYMAPVRVDATRVAAIQVGQRLDGEVQTLRGLRNLLAVLAPIALLLALGGGLFMASRALAPMERMRRTVQGIIESGDLSQRVSKGLPGDEVGLLAQTFDGLLSRVETAIDRERQFTADASHELRSPLTAIKGELGVALARPRTADQYRDTLSDMAASVDDMTGLVEDLLTLARVGNTSSALENIDLADLARTVCSRLSVVAESKSITLTPPEPTTRGAAQCLVKGDRRQLQRLITNLIDNALRYTEEGTVSVECVRLGSFIILSVRDTGMGISAEHLPHIFDRFYRAEQARSRESGGSGLGLAMVQVIVQKHFGRISVDSTPGKGTLFTVRLPAS